MNFFKKKPRETSKLTLYKYFCMFKTIDGKKHRYDIDKWCASDTSFLEYWAIRDGYIKDNFDNVYPMTSILSFSWNYWEKWEIEYYTEWDFIMPDFPSDKYIEKIRVKG